ncbi:hypothetical protein D9615_009182 [Tricholomella constricta]|uniref:CxC2-like cysteine cluster KDZ transposase-associated domain-containing protein n=1 Tax=Tricholomella constricta TaxID=117010 RepID=A0A8H5H2K6_9AGAR|nr:hypothetical protein D9615_009182 [Tricholomella constricta]
MSTKRRSKKKNQNLQLRAHALPEFNRAETPPPRPIHIPLTRYHTLPSGNLGSSTSYHPICVSPSKQPGPPLSSVVEPSISDYEPTNVSAPSDAQWVDPAYLDHLEDTVVAPRARRRADNPLMCWIPDRDMFVAEDIRWDGRGEHLDQLCPECGAGEPRYQCEDCEGGQLLCHECTLAAHCRNSLHRLKAWNGSFFKKASLKSLGLRIQLGHRVGEACSNPKPAFANDFVVVHVNGIHEVALDFCDCQTAQLHFIQLLRFRWFPATVTQPKSAATFSVLKHFHLLTFESKASSFEFYNALARLTDNVGVDKVKDHYSAFMRMVREYRHVKMLKRFGRGHDPTGAPGLNLPPDWQNAPDDQRWLYRLFVALDANFRLKRKHVSNSVADPALGDGMSYFVRRQEYVDFLNEFGTLIIQDPSTCSNHKAVDAEHSTKGLAATGVGTIDCAHHDVKRPKSVGDLQRSERYVNMDYLFWSSLEDSDQVELVVSYDIVCQWSVKIWQRYKKYRRWTQYDENGQRFMIFLIPKFHLPAHIMACQTVFSFNFNTHVGRTDGEAPERGSRQDTLDDHFGDWNWKKTVLMGISLLRKVKVAVAERSEQTFRYHQFEMGLEEAHVAPWRIELKLWLEDHCNPNPFESRYKALSQDGVRRELAKQDAADLTQGSAYVLHETVSASQLITLGIDLEEQQRRLTVNAAELGPHSTDIQNMRIQVWRNILKRKINAWIDIEHLYIPALSLARSKTAEDQDDHLAEKIPLMLPSSIPRQLPCDTRLQEMEWMLRQSQANDALDELREGLRLQAYLYIDKDRFQRGQHHNTRSRGIIQQVKVKIDAAARKYRVAREALCRLAEMLGKVGWNASFPFLADSDIKQLSGNNDESEGRRTISWIWTRYGAGSQLDCEEGLQDILRIEWCKSKARADRWSEEVQLLLEEMRRVLEFFESMAVKWEQRPAAMCFVEKDGAMLEALHAYAARQASQFRSMKDHCSYIWRFVPQYVELGLGVDVVPPELNELDDD